MIFYHATRPENLKQVKREGLTPRVGVQGMDPKAVWLARGRSGLFKFYDPRSNYIVLEVNGQNLDQYLLRPHVGTNNVKEGVKHDTFTYKATIPPRDLRLVGQRYWGFPGRIQYLRLRCNDIVSALF